MQTRAAATLEGMLRPSASSSLLCLSASDQLDLTELLVYSGQLTEPKDSDVLTHKHDIRNIAIIAHVDHGKTTLVSIPCYAVRTMSKHTSSSLFALS